MIDRLEIHNEIEKIAQEANTDYIDAVLHYCTKNDLEIETVGLLLAQDPNLVEKIQIDAENLHFIKKTSRLPI